ncbi:MAG: peptide ABC transporter substrate-binding protein [Alcaligenaceae bacterium]|nr:peptide ABC transporter substrate-binding protein [Alcaligenaceae bacterium]
MKQKILAICLASCLGFSVSGQAMAEKVLRLNNTEEPTSLNPAAGFNLISWEPLNNLVEGLVRLDEKHLAAPATAASWHVSDDGKTYTFKLQPNAKWSNGDALTAHDFVYAWTTMLAPETASPAAFLAYPIAGAKAFNEGKEARPAIKALDDQTLEVTLEAPNVSFLNIITNPNFAPVNQKTATQNPKWHAEAKTYVSNGPFLLKEWEHAQSMRFEKNPHYWDTNSVKIDAIEFAMVNDPNTSYQMYRTGELDMTPSPLPSALYDKVKDNKDFRNVPQAGGYFFRFNTNMPPFQNADIRKAFALAVNQEDIVNYVTKQGRQPSYGFVAPGFTGPNGKDFREENGNLVKTDTAQAKQLLQKGMAAENYTVLPDVTLSYINNPSDKKIAETLQHMYKEALGVDIRLQSIESKVFYAKQRGLELQFSRSSFVNDYADPYNSLESFLSGSSMNRTGWSNPEYDKLINQADTEADAQKRWDMLLQAEKILFNDMPVFPLFFYNQIYLQKENISGILRHPVGYIDLKYTTIN